MMPNNLDVLEELKLTIDELFYNSNSLFYLSEQINILHEITKMNITDRRTKNVLIFEILSKFCQLIESFGAHINAFEESNKFNLNTEEVLKYLVNYTPGTIPKAFSLFNDDPPQTVPSFYNKIKMAYGYNKINTPCEIALEKIFTLLIPIFQTYYFYLNAYNAGKHGYRIFHFQSFDPENDDPMMFLDKLKGQVDSGDKSAKNFKLDYVPISEDTLNKNIIPHYNDLIFLYRILMKNNKFIVENRSKDIIIINDKIYQDYFLNALVLSI
jgi:hypothetical protein